MTEAGAVEGRVREHTAAIGRADVDALRGLYAADARLCDPAGSEPVVGRTAIGDHFARWLVPRAVEVHRVIVTGPDAGHAVVSFTATPADGRPVDIVDVLELGPDLLIRSMSAYARART